ncbi:hypothetical protein Avbf_11644 [Armadillidium vulgare]|nr:hypothetical protein Avbf_11644 [Armadillidium vulgare]
MASQWPLGDGTFGEVRYVADENGYRPESSLIPTPHPLPAHAVEQIRIAEEQRARGIRIYLKEKKLRTESNLIGFVESENIFNLPKQKLI